MRADLAARSSLDLTSTVDAGESSEAPVMHTRGGNAELLRHGGTAAGEPVSPRAKRVGPILHAFRIRSERRGSQLDLFPNLNASANEGDFIRLMAKKGAEAQAEPGSDFATAYIRSELQRLEEERRGALYDLERAGGFSGGHISKLKNDEARTMKVGVTVIQQFIRGRGVYKDIGDFYLKAGQWWESIGRSEWLAWRETGKRVQQPMLIEDPELRIAVEMTAGLADNEIIKTVMRKHADEVGKQDRHFWIEQMNIEARLRFKKAQSESFDKFEKRRSNRKVAAERKKATDSTREIPEPESERESAVTANDKRRRR